MISTTLLRLTDFHEYEVGDIHHVVDGPQPYSQQFLLQPLGRGCYLDVGKGYAHIAGSTVMTDHLDGNGLSRPEVSVLRPDR